MTNVSRSTLRSVIQARVSGNSEIDTDYWSGYNGLIDLGYKKHHRVEHNKDEFVNEHSHINGIEGFWGIAKTRLSRFKGLHKSMIYLHIKECEFRYNRRKENIYRLLLRVLKNKPLKLS